MLGMAVVMNETVMLGYLLKDSIKKNTQTLVTANYPPASLVLAILSHFIPHHQNGCLFSHMGMKSLAAAVSGL